SDYLRIDGDKTELWRVSLRLGATGGVDYGSFVSELQSTVEPVVAAQNQRQIILHQLASKLGTISGKRVLLVGMPGKQEIAEGEGAEALSLETPVDQDRIFARSLSELLVNSRLRVKSHPL